MGKVVCIGFFEKNIDAWCPAEEMGWAEVVIFKKEIIDRMPEPLRATLTVGPDESLCPF
jgi:hypothetical protein